MDFKHDIGNECGFHIDKKDDDVFCSPYIVVNKLKEITNTKNASDKDTLKTLKDKFKCDTEICILKTPEVIEVIRNIDTGMTANQIVDEYFKPEGPRNNNKWLSNTDIDSVLDQIQRKYVAKHFLHITFQMIDFESTQSELAVLDWPEKYTEGFRTFGTVFNTDTSRGNGKHWFAIYGSFEDSGDFTLEYFNSSGELPMNQISKWIKRAKF